jgi:HD-like signal output (HDOD) protein/CheY-like chemotaxis protein
MPGRKRILFVDDDASVLAAVANLMFRDRKRWDTATAPGGQPALDALRTTPADVVVSDMRMPGMDGAELLEIVKREFPATARIMLTGYAEEDAITRALPVVHQLLSKPCTASTLRTAIARALGDDERGGEARTAILALDRLPSPPQAYAQLARAVESRSTTIDQLVAIIQRDPSASAKVLQIANSAYLGSLRPTASIADAVRMLGLERLRHVASTASVFGGDSIPDLAARQAHAVRVAQLATRFAPGEEETYAAGLLHDVGSLVPFGGDAGDGAELLALWGLPAAIVDVVRYHRLPDRAPAPVRTVASAVHVAVALCAPETGVLDTEALERAGTAGLVPAWRELAAQSLPRS